MQCPILRKANALAAGGAMLEVRGLSKSFRSIPALRNVSFTAPPGHVTGYLGANGSGKSTTFKIVAGLLEPSSGEVLWNGRSAHSDPLAFKQILGYVPEEPHLYSHLGGAEYLELAGQLRLIPSRLLLARMERFLRLFDLWEDRHSLLGSYSKGMKQKILLAAALLDDPQLIILDEPFNGLDLHSALVLRQFISSLADAGKCVLMSSHEFETVEKVATRVVILHEGAVVADDEVGHLRHLMQLPTLEAIFTQLALREKPADRAAQLLAAVQLREA
jgi:ABC-2 type transport system ATP-binding protein